MPISIKQKRSNRIRYKLKKNNKGLPRLSVFKSSKCLYVQIIDDNQGKTICSASSVKSAKQKNACNIENAKILGAEIAKAAKEKGITNIYHGIIKNIADEARSNGLSF